MVAPSGFRSIFKVKTNCQIIQFTTRHWSIQAHGSERALAFGIGCTSAVARGLAKTFRWGRMYLSEIKCKLVTIVKFKIMLVSTITLLLRMAYFVVLVWCLQRSTTQGHSLNVSQNIVIRVYVEELRWVRTVQSFVVYRLDVKHSLARVRWSTWMFKRTL